ncbi:hypothetical protein PMAYCL1PPCAC_24067, partial [Pristionchus mayeri]
IQVCEMSKQSSLMSFFTPKGSKATPTVNASPQVSTPSSKKNASTPKTPKSSRAPLKRVNERVKNDHEREDNEDVVEKEPKRRRVIISDSDSSEAESESECYDPSKEEEEVDEEEYDDPMDDDDETPKKKKSAKKGRGTTSSKAETDNRKDEEEDKEGVESDGEFVFDPAMANSFIGSFGMKEDDISEKVKSLLDVEVTVDSKRVAEEEKPKGKKKEGDEDEKVEEYTHEKLEFLKPDRIRDVYGRRPDDADYDHTTVKIPDQFIKEQTPGHQQWWTIKSFNFDTVLLFKVGKFYELYHMDATVAVNCLNLAYMKGSYAHCGFPESAYGRFADQLVQRGYKVARIEQTETPDQLSERNKKERVKSKVVRRELCRVTTCATRTYDALDSPLDDGKSEEGGGDGGGRDSNNAFLLAIKEVISVRGSQRTPVTTFGVAFIDTSIGRFFVGSFEDDCYFSHLRTLIARHPPAQVLVERNRMSNSTRSVLSSMLPSSVPTETLTPKKEFLEPEKTITLLLDGSRLGGDTHTWPSTLVEMLSRDESLPTSSPSHREAWSALGALLSYLGKCLIDRDMVSMKLFETFDPTAAPMKSLSSNLCSSSWKGRRMVIDGVGLEQLSLIPLEYASEQTSGSLYSILNRCKTPFGARLLRSWICAPSCDKEVIEERQKAVVWLMTAEGRRCQSSVEELLENLPDLERLLQKIHSVGLLHRAREHPDSRAVMFEGEKYAKRKIKDLIAALEGFKLCHQIGELCEGARKGEKKNSLLAAAPFDVKKHLEHFEDAFDAREAESTGKIIPNEGTDGEYDAARERVEKMKEKINDYSEEMGRKLQCKTSLVNCGKDRNLLEVPDKVKVPSNFEKKTMKKGFVRYTNEKLLSLNCELGEAESDLECLLKDATRRVFEDFDQRRDSWQGCLDAVSTLDVLISLAKYGSCTGVPMCVPSIVYDEEKPVMEVEEGYHPCIVVTGLASLLDEGVESSSTTFIPNDINLGGSNPSTLLLTGPNMGGKSTLMRQVAVLSVLSQIGSLVPAKSMRLSPIDRIFTRLGASDRLVAGQSTFFVEMNESAIALRDATKHSFALFDELGRGTGTLDGQSLAWAIMQSMTKRIGARSIFSTHYHGLCERVEGDKEISLMHMGCVVEDEEETAETARVTKESVTFLYKLVPGVCPRSFGFNAARLAGIEEHVIADSWRAAKRTFGDQKTLKKLKEEAERGASVETLRRLIETAF